VDSEAKQITLTWDKADATVTAFKVYVAGTENADGTLLGTVSVADAGDPLTAVFDTTKQQALSQYLGSDVCLRLTAVAGDIESEKSAAVCVSL